MNTTSRIISAIALATALTQCSPAQQSNSGSVGPSGGTLSLGGLTLVVPAGAVDRMVILSVTPIDDRPAGYSLEGRAFRFAPSGLRFSSPITVSMPGQPSGANAIYWSVEGDESRFERVPTTFNGSVATAQVSHFSVGFVGAASAPSTGVTCSVLRRRVVGPSMCTQDETIESNVGFRLVPVSLGEDPQGAITTDSQGIRELFLRSTDDYPYFTGNAARTVYEAPMGASFGRAERTGSMISFSMNAARGGTIVPGCETVPLIAVRCSGDTTLGGAPPPADVPSSDASDAADVLSDTGVPSDAASDAGMDATDSGSDTGAESGVDTGVDAPSGVSCTVRRRRVAAPMMCVQDVTVENNVSFRFVAPSPGGDPEGALTTTSAGIRELFNRAPGETDYPYFYSDAMHLVYEAGAGPTFGRANRSGRMITFSLDAARAGSPPLGCETVPLIAVTCSGNTTVP